MKGCRLRRGGEFKEVFLLLLVVLLFLTNARTQEMNQSFRSLDVPEQTVRATFVLCWYFVNCNKRISGRIQTVWAINMQWSWWTAIDPAWWAFSVATEIRYDDPLKRAPTKGLCWRLMSLFLAVSEQATLQLWWCFQSLCGKKTVKIYSLPSCTMLGSVTKILN